MARIVICLLCCCLGIIAVQAQSPADSLLQVLARTKPDTAKVRLYDELCRKYGDSDLEKSAHYGRLGLALARQLQDQRGTASVLNNLAYALQLIGHTDTALLYLHEAQGIAQTIQDSELQLSIANSFGIAHWSQSDHLRALNAFMEVKKLAEQAKNEGYQAIAYSNIGLIYSELGEISTSNEWMFRSLSLSEKKGDKISAANDYLNLAANYHELRQYSLAKKYARKGADIYQVAGMDQALAIAYNTLGDVAFGEDSLELAEKYYTLSIQKGEQVGDKQTLARNYLSIAKLYRKQRKNRLVLQYINKSLQTAVSGQNSDAAFAAYAQKATFLAALHQYEAALQAVWQALHIARRSEAPRNRMEAYQAAADIYAATTQYDSAYLYHTWYVAVKDSLFNEKNVRRTALLQSIYDAESQDQKIKVLEKDKQLRQKEQRDQQILIWALLLIGAFIIGMTFFLYRNNVAKQATNRLLMEKNTEISQQKEEMQQVLDTVRLQSVALERQNRETTDSILYAKRIQQALLPFDERLRQIFPDSFVYYRPRNIVSGDFYWVDEYRDKLFIAVADCTGHGVPGAFMSLLCYTSFSQAILNLGKTAPDQILHEADRDIRHSLKQAITGNTDGMDVAILVIDRQQGTVQYAGAKNSLYYFVEGDPSLREIKADHYSIGGERFDKEKNFTCHTLTLDSPMVFYLYSDGYADQFGGDRGRKMMVSRFKQLLTDIHHQDMVSQEVAVEKYLCEWMGREEQVDDITVIGLRLQPKVG